MTSKNSPDKPSYEDKKPVAENKDSYYSGAGVSESLEKIATELCLQQQKILDSQKARALKYEDMLKSKSEESGLSEEQKEQLSQKESELMHEQEESLDMSELRGIQYEILLEVERIFLSGDDRVKRRALKLFNSSSEKIRKGAPDVMVVMRWIKEKLSALVPVEPADSEKKRETFSSFPDFPVAPPDIMGEPRMDNLEDTLVAERIMGLFGREEGQHISFYLDDITGHFADGDKGHVLSVLSGLQNDKKLVTVTDKKDKVFYLCRDMDILDYTPDELISLLNSKYFNNVGEYIKQAIDSGNGQIDISDLADFDTELHMPLELIEQIVHCYVAKGVITRSGRKYKLSKNIGDSVPNFSMIRNVDLAMRFTDIESDESRNNGEMADVKAAYKEYGEKNKCDELEFIIKKDGVRMMHITEAMFGYKDLDVGFLDRMMGYLENLPDSEKPDVFVVSGLLFGNFQHKQKGNRRAKVFSENNQLKAAKNFLERCKKFDIPIIYNMSDNDMNIVESRTYDALKILENLRKAAKEKDDSLNTMAFQKDTQKSAASYYGFDKMKQSKLWEYHYRFQYDVVFEYMLRCGRRLYSADEMEDKFGVRVEEYLLLLEAYNDLSNGIEPDVLSKEILEIDKIPLKGQRKDDFAVTKNFDAKFKTNGRDINLLEFHEFRQTPVTMPTDPTKALRSVIKQMKAMGEKTPDMTVVENQEMCLGVLEEGSLVVSTPSMNTYQLKQGAYSSMIQEDKGVRRVKNRMDYAKAGAISTEIRDDGVIRIRFYNEHFLDLANKSKERVAIIHNSDWQTGSVTARPDYQAKWLDYVFHKILTKHKGFMIFNGDIIQARNYPGMPNENTNMGLVKIDDQIEFIRSMIDKVLEGAPEEARLNLSKVGIVPGNHEWNSGYNFTGTTFSRFLQYPFRHHKINSEVYEMLGTKRGEHFKAFTGVEEFGGHKMVFQHMFLEKGAKGVTGLPIMQAKELVTGGGGLVEDVDLLFAGHFHFPQFAALNNKIASINGSLAGLSGYEWARGYNPVIGATIMYVGGGLPPELEIFTADALNKYKAEGHYSDENLKKEGFETDPNFNPEEHGFGRVRVPDGVQFEQLPQSAIQKSLWKDVDEILWQVQGMLGHKKK